MRGTLPGAQRGARTAYVYGAAGLAWVAAHAFGWLGPSLAKNTFTILAFGAVVTTIVGVRRHRPSPQWPWWMLGGAMSLFFLGGMARMSYMTFGNVTETRSLVPDLITMPGYVLFGVGLLGLARSRGRKSSDFDVLLDGVVAALGTLALAWVFIINPVLSQAHAPLSVRLVLGTYPAMSLFLLVVMWRLAFSFTDERGFSDRLLLGVLSFTLIGDVIYTLMDAGLAVFPFVAIDVPYALGYVGWGAAVLHPSMRALSQSSRPTSQQDVPSVRRIAFVAIALALPALVIVAWDDHGTHDDIAIAGIIVALTGAAVIRVLRALRAHARAESAMAHQAMHDSLTGLPNRSYVETHTAGILEMAAVQSTSVAVLFLDVDRFKLVNDTFGHTVGDELLVAVTQRLRRNVRQGDFVARIGGDEFVVVLTGIRDVGEALARAESIRCCFHAPFLVRESEIYASASVGVAYAHGTGEIPDAESMIREADTAMYQAKAGGRDGVEVFDASMRDRTVERLSLEQDLRQALAAHQLGVHYQPVVDIESGRAQSVEALVRWNHPVLGNVPPDKFIPVAEDSGLILEIGTWVLIEACHQVAGWRRDLPGAADLALSVNLSALQMRDPHLVDKVIDALVRSGLPADALTLELTESCLMENPEQATDILVALRNLGVKLAVDDFGTGYSSLAYLKRFPVNYVKIDRTFVDGLDNEDSSEESLVAAITAMTKALNLTAVAEGVETEAQRQVLSSLGCPLAQGYLYARPLPAAELPLALFELAGAGEAYATA